MSCEDGRGLAVERGVAEVVLPGAAERRVDDELLGGGVVGRGGADGRDIRAVPRLGHRERARQFEVDHVAQPRVVVLLRPELVDRGAEQSPLHAGLDLQARIGEHELHEPGEIGAVVLQAAVLLRERAARAAPLDEESQLAEHAVTVFRHGLTLDAPERGVLDHLAGLAAGLAPRPEQQVGDGIEVDAGFARLVGGVRGGRRATGGSALAGGGLLGTDGGVGHGGPFDSGQGESLSTVGVPQRLRKPVAQRPQRPRAPRHPSCVRPTPTKGETQCHRGAAGALGRAPVAAVSRAADVAKAG